ncbi:NAD-dependent epimerase/dehydratase family protein [Bacillus luti]|uniref:NAD-dependent epimerase/dehydratase family protein n=1 Tax=Bacillus luti TaxID=2026191 RepID=UPI003D033D60
MKIFIAGATGVIGHSLLPMLINEGHKVFAMIRNESQVEEMKKVGATLVIADIFNRKAVFSVLKETTPDVVIHQLTSLSTGNFEDNAKIRIKGTRNLVDAAKNVEAKRMIAQSISWAYWLSINRESSTNNFRNVREINRSVQYKKIISLEKSQYYNRSIGFFIFYKRKD